ncbi:MAG: RNA polymerase sigma factor RpoD/SigA [Anaerolineales bacterium]
MEERYDVEYKPLPVRPAEAPDDLLTHEEEIKLAKILAQGRWAEKKLARATGSGSQMARWRSIVARAAAARDELVLRNQGLVGKVARRYFDTGLTFEDLMQEGQVGLIKAANRYDPGRGTRFSTYAVWWIRQAIGRAVANTGRMIRLPVNLGQRVMQVRRTELELAQALGRNATHAEVADKLEWTVEQVETVTNSVIPVTRLEQLIGPRDSADTELQELLPDETVLRPDEEADVNLLADEVARALSGLTPVEANILRLRYGFVDGEVHPLSDLARKYGLSREGMRQAANRALDKIRTSEHASDLKEFL